MGEGEREVQSEEISVLSIGSLLLRNRWRVARWAALGAFVTLAAVWTRPVVYPATASFIPAGADGGRSALASLAGQLGVNVSASSTTSPTLTPDFYVRLLTSREILGNVARDTFVVAELGNRRVAVEDLFDAKSGSAKAREEAAVKELTRRVSAEDSKTTGIVEFRVGTQWPSVSLAISRELVEGVNAFNERTRRDQASAERKFIDGRLDLAQTQLRAAEDRLQQFLQGNRQAGSPDLQFTHDRMQREVTFRQQLVTSLAQSSEEARMREVRDIPVITMVDEPMVPVKPDSRGRAIRTVIGLLIGAAVGALIVFLGDIVAKRRAAGDPAADEFARAVEGMRARIRRTVRGRGKVSA